MKNIAKLSRVIVLCTFGLLFGCKSEEQGDPIVIPPGQLISYSNSDFVGISKAFYTVELQRLEPTANKFFAIEDITPKENKDVSSTFKHILPKDENKLGVYIIKVPMTRVGISMSSFVLASRVNTPGIISTLAVDLFTGFPEYNLESIKDQTVLDFEAELEKSKLRVIAEFGIGPQDMTTKQWIKFLKNYIGRDKLFLTFAESRGFSFSSSQDFLKLNPYVFNNDNKVPTLDEGNSTPTNRNIIARESVESTIKARLLDPDGDFLVYRWSIDGQPYSKEPSLIKWTPDYDKARPETYPAQALVTDGGTPQQIDWDIEVLDFNRPPVLSSDCDMKVKEWQEWTCLIKAQDFDGDPITFSISDKVVDARVTANGQGTDDTTRKVTISGTSEIELKFTPNNQDARRRFGYIEVTLTDGKIGSTVVPLTVIIEDINLPPQLVLVGNSPLQTMVPGTVPHEWDYCADADPDGLGPYRFMIEVRDPDNQPGVGIRSAIPDNVTASFGGSLKDDMTLIPESGGCPASSPEVGYFCFEWKPHNTPRTGTLTLTLKDDHGGITQIPSPDIPEPIRLSFEDRNVKPCIKANTVDSLMSDTQTNILEQFSGTDDDDETSPWPQLSDVPAPVMPLLTSLDATFSYLIFRKDFFNPSLWVFRFPKSTAGISTGAYTIWNKRPIAGSVVFSRATPHTSDIVINTGTLISTSPLPLRIKYEVAQTVTFYKNDLEVMVPVRAYDRNVAIGKLNRWISAVPANFASGTVSNPLVLSGGGMISVTRSSGATLEFLPAGSEVGTNELVDGTESVRYITMDNVKFDIAETTKSDVRVSRKQLFAGTGSVTVIPSATWLGPPLSVNNLFPLSDVSSYTLARDLQYGSTMGVDRFCWHREFADSSAIPANTSISFLGAALPGITVTNSSPLELEGYLQVNRSDTTGLQTLTPGTVFKTPDRTLFEVAYALALNPGVPSGTVAVRRINHTNPPPLIANSDRACVGWSDTNYEPSFLNPTIAKVTEGQALLDFEIKVTDNRNDPSSPNDPLDRHTFTSSFLGNAPQGSSMLCREPGDNMADINSPACTPCTNTTGTYFETSSCFLRFKPVLNDVSFQFGFNFTVNDNGLNYPLNTNIRSQPTSVRVVEINDPPVHTDENFLPINNTTENAAPYLGDFIEGIESKYRIYMTDPDKGSDLKNLIAPVLEDVLVFWTPLNQWKSLGVPSGVYTELVAASVPDPGGWGSKTTAQIRWTPNDRDAKQMAYTNGVVFKIKACDMGSPDSPRECTSGYYRFKTRNVNNLPSNATNLGNLTFNVDTYINQWIYFKDNDFATNSTMDYRPNPPDTNFFTRLSLCSAPGIYNCEADQTGWPAALSSYDPAYTGNAAASSCQTGGVLTDKKLPQLFRYQPSGSPNNPTVSGCVGKTYWNYNSASDCDLDKDYRSYLYYFRWCPQRSHIGKHLIYLTLRDNGDEDIEGVALPPQIVQVPMQMKVVAPVFFESPKKSTGNNDATWWMKQAFSQLEYRYEIFINASRENKLDLTLPVRALVGSTTIGNPTIELRTYTNPSVVASSSTTGLYNFDLRLYRVFLVWKPYALSGSPAVQVPYFSNPSDQATWPYFRLTVKDRTTNETETVQFRVQVKNSVSPVNAIPSLDSYWPPQANVLVKEQVTQAFSVSGSDTNGDYLHYRWYLDGKLVWDAGNSYNYVPDLNDAFLPSTSPGLHTLKVEILDGQERNPNTSWTWNVKVRNTIPLPQRLTYANTSNTLWTFAQSVKERLGSSTVISNLIWGPTVGAATTSAGVTNNNLLFTGSYLRSNVVRNFVWRIQFTNATFTDNTTTSSTQGSEILPWSGGRKSEQISYIQSNMASLNNILVASRPDPEGSFSSTSDAVTLSPSLTSISSLNSGNACTGTCSYNFFNNVVPPSSTAPLPGTLSSSGTMPSAGYTLSGNTYYFFTSNQGASLRWSRAGSMGNSIVDLPGNDRVGDIAVNPITQRLYVTARDPSLFRNYIYIFNISGVGSGTVSLVTILNVFDGVSADNRILDLAVDPAKNRAYALLPGTGGVVALNDNGVSVPTTGNLTFIGVNNIGSSFTDNPGEGRKLVFNPSSEILYGLAKDAYEVFTIDTRNDAFTTKTFRADMPLDEIITFDNDGLTLAINRFEGWIYKVW